MKFTMLAVVILAMVVIGCEDTTPDGVVSSGDSVISSIAGKWNIAPCTDRLDFNGKDEKEDPPRRIAIFEVYEVDQVTSACFDHFGGLCEPDESFRGTLSEPGDHLEGTWYQDQDRCPLDWTIDFDGDTGTGTYESVATEPGCIRDSGTMKLSRWEANKPGPPIVCPRVTASIAGEWNVQALILRGGNIHVRNPSKLVPKAIRFELSDDEITGECVISNGESCDPDWTFTRIPGDDLRGIWDQISGECRIYWTIEFNGRFGTGTYKTGENDADCEFEVGIIELTR